MEGFKSIALLLNCPDFSQALGQKGKSNLTESPFPTKIKITVGVLSPFARSQTVVTQSCAPDTFRADSWSVISQQKEVQDGTSGMSPLWRLLDKR
jgi:hypothetical protein